MRKLVVLTVILAMIIGGAGSIASARQEITIDFWNIQITDPGPEITQNAVDRFNAEHPEVNLVVETLQNDPFKIKIRTAMGAGDAPCIFPSWGGGPLYEYVVSGQVIDLTPYMEADGYVDRFLPAALSNTSIDGKIYGVPVENTAVAVIYYNKQLFEQYGLEPPATWGELLTVAQTLIDNGVTPFSLANKTKWTSSMYYMYLVDRLGGPAVFASAANRTGGSFEDPVFVKAGEMVQELVNMGAFIEGFNGLDYDTGQSRMPMYANQAAMELMGTWQIATYKAENEDFYNNALGFFPFPAVEDGLGSPTNVVGTVGDNYYHISSNCEHPEEAFEFIKYLIDDESVALRVERGRIPPVVGVSTMLSDPLLQEVMAMVENAESVQLWYDQFLPPELGEVHKDTMQALFGLDITPEEAAAAQEEAVAEFFGK